MDNPKKPSKIAENPVKTQKTVENTTKASTKEIVVMICTEQRRQGEKLDKLAIEHATLKQEVHSYIADKKEDEHRDDKRTDRSQSNIKWIVGFAVSTTITIVVFLWNVLK